MDWGFESAVSGSAFYCFNAVAKGLEIKEPNRHLYLAIPAFAYNYFESMRLIQLGIEKYQVKMIVFDHDNETIESWIN